MHEPLHHRRPQLVRQEAIDARISPDWFRRRSSFVSARKLSWHAGLSVLACAGLLTWFAQTRHAAWTWFPAVVEAAPGGCANGADASARCTVRIRLVNGDVQSLAPLVSDGRVAVRVAQRTLWLSLAPADGGVLVADWPPAVPLPSDARIGVRQPGASLLARLLPHSPTADPGHGN